MPNNTQNIMKVIGEKEAVAKCFDLIKGKTSNDPNREQLIDFEKIIPMPEHIFRGSLGEKERELYGENNWYDWSVDNWGTKWNAYYCERIDDSTIKFFTAWSVPEPIYKNISEMFPSLKFEFKYSYEDEQDTEYTDRYKAGEKVYLND